MDLTSSLQPLPPLPPLPEPEFPTIYPPGEAPPPEPEYRDWWLSVAKWVGNWIVDNILKPGTEWFISLVEWVVAELRYWKHKFFELLAEIYAMDGGFLVLLAATITLAIYIPQLVAYLKATSIGKVISGIVAWIKESTGKLLNLIGFVDLVAINQILQAVWPEWRDLMIRLSDATSALAEELGQGSGYLHAWFSVVRGFTMSTTAFLDLDPEVAELWAFEDQNAALIRINERFRRYAHDPGEIVRDIIEELYIPYANKIRDSQQSLIGSVTENRDRSLSLYDSLRKLQGALDHFIAIQPDETAAIVEEKLGPIADSLKGFLDDFQLHVLPAINQSLTALEQRADWIEAANAVVAEKVDDPLYTLARYDLMTDAEKSVFNRGIMLIAEAASTEEIETAEVALDLVGASIMEATADMLYEPISLPAPRRPALSLELPTLPSTALFPSWYRGED